MSRRWSKAATKDINDNGAHLSAGYEAGKQTIWGVLWQYEHREKETGRESLERSLNENWP